MAMLKFMNSSFMYLATDLHQVHTLGRFFSVGSARILSMAVPSSRSPVRSATIDRRRAGCSDARASGPGRS